MRRPSSPRFALERLLVLALAMLALPAAAHALSITRLSSPVMYVGSTGSTPGHYAGYRIVNDGPSAVEDLWVTVGTFTGGVVAPASREDATRHVGPLAPGASAAIYFYLVASGPTAIAQTHEVRVHSGPPSLAPVPIATGMFSLTVESALVAQAYVQNATLAFADPPEVGSTLIMTVDGATGTIGSAGVMAFSPASLPDWPADVLELVGVHTDLLCDGSPSSHDDGLYFLQEPVNCSYQTQYTFRCTGTAPAPIPISPVIRVSSGLAIKQSRPVDEQYVGSPVSRLRLEKTVNPTALASAGTVTYTLRWINEGARPSLVDLLIDDLPATPAATSYVAGSARFQSLPIPNPTVVGQRLWFSRPFDVPATGSSAITFDAAIPGTTGQYVNLARARSGSVAVDFTTDPSDDVPASASVVVGSVGVGETGITAAFLHPAYPQPCRESSTIRFDLARAEFVTLRVTDVLGRTVAVLVRGQRLPAGRHAASFDGRGLGSGVYSLRLQAGDFALARRLVVLH